MNKIKITKETQFAVLGLGKFGRSVAETLYKNGYDVLCCDIDEHIVEEATEFSTYAVQADITDEDALEKIGIRNMDVVIIALSTDFEVSIMTSMIVKDMGVPYVMAKTNGSKQKKILEAIGVNQVIIPEKQMGEKIAMEFITNNLLENIHQSDEYSILEINPKPEWIGKSLEELSLRKNEGINVIALINSHEIKAVFDPATVLNKDDIMVVVKAEDV